MGQKNNMHREDGSLWRKANAGVYVCDLLKPYVGKPVTDKFWNSSIKEKYSNGTIR